MLDLITAVLLAAAKPKVYVDGYGWVTSRSVGACLHYVGEPNVDALTDGKWEQFTDCLNDEQGGR
jgi:hypothetical protein